MVRGMMPFNHQDKKYYCNCFHSRKLIFAVVGWIAYQFFHDLFFIFFMEMNVPLRIVYALYLGLAILAILGILAAFYTKNELFIIPAIIFLILAIITNIKEILISIWALIFPNSNIHEGFGELFRSASPLEWFVNGHRVLRSVYYPILKLCIVPFILALLLLFLVITIKFYRYYHDWRADRKNIGPTIVNSAYSPDNSRNLGQTVVIN